MKGAGWRRGTAHPKGLGRGCPAFLTLVGNRGIAGGAKAALKRAHSRRCRDEAAGLAWLKEPKMGCKRGPEGGAWTIFARVCRGLPTFVGATGAAAGRRPARREPGDMSPSRKAASCRRSPNKGKEGSARGRALPKPYWEGKEKVALGGKSGAKWKPACFGRSWILTTQ